MLKSDRLFKLLIRGLPTSTKVEEIRVEIEREGFQIHKISRLQKFRTKAPMPLIYLQLVSDAKADTIFQFTEIFGTQISFERYDNSRNKKPNQCWRCQIANDEGVDEELLARAFRAALPALRKLSHPDDKACEIFQAYVALKNGRNILIIAGDLNAAHKTWNNTRSNNFGFRLKRIIQNYPNARIVAPYTPTHINSRSRLGVRDSIINLAFFKNIPFNYDIRVIDDLCSDHLPVILTLYTNSDTMKIPAQLSINWENFRFLLKNKPLSIPASPSNEHLDVAIGRLEENISEALVSASKPKFKTAPIKLPPDIRSKIRHRNRVRRFWQKSRDPALKNELRTIRNEIASDIRHLSRARWEKTIEELSPETSTLWRCTSFLKKPFHHIPPLKGALGSIAVAPIEKAEVIADSLQKQFEPNTDVEILDSLHIYKGRNEILHKDLKIDPILDFIENPSKTFFDRLPQFPNQSIRVIPAYDNSVPSSAKRPRAALHHIDQHFPVLKRLRRS
ncbi:RNA-directed DNA polymerase from mobile element jockey [Trichonephila clavipes]|nr:RNA-directed DNA polymerase from mobile element jockey [Trichonephila clavipes]